MLALLSAAAHGQQLPAYSQYLYNKILVNPSVAGSDGLTRIGFAARQQWVGHEGAPRTFSASLQTRVLKQQSGGRKGFMSQSDGRVGLGGYVFSDKNGLVSRNGAQLSYAYHTWIDGTTQLSFGLAANAYLYRIDANRLSFENPDDPVLNSSLRRGVFVPDATFGVSLLSPRYHAGISVDQLFEASGKIGGSGAYDDFNIKRHYFLFGSYDLRQGYHNVIQPSFLLMMSEQLLPQADIGVTYIFRNDFRAGVAYRTTKAMIATVGINYSNMFFGYAFDFTLQELQSVTYGTHELSFAMKFGDTRRRYQWLDRF